VNGTNKKCCPLPSPGTHEVYSIDAGTGACTKSCKPGYRLDSNRCIQVNYCNPYLFEDITSNVEKGYLSYYNKNDVSDTLGTNTCPVGVDESLKTRDGCTTIRKIIDGVGRDFTYCCSENGFVYDLVSDTCRKLCDNNENISNIIEFQDIYSNEIQKRTPIETPKYYKSVASKATDCATNSFEECKPNYTDITFNYDSLYSKINTGGSTTQASDFVSYDIIDNITNEVTTVTNLASSGASTNPSDNDNIDRKEIKICSRVTKDCYKNLRDTQGFNNNGNYYRLSNVNSECTSTSLPCTPENSSCPGGYLETNASEITDALLCPVPVEGELITCTTGINLIDTEVDGGEEDIVKCDDDNRYIPSSKRCVSSDNCSPYWRTDGVNTYGVNTYTSREVFRNDSGDCSPSYPTTIESVLSDQSIFLNVDTNCIGIPDSGTIPYTTEYKCCSEYTKGKPYLATNDNTYTCDKVWTSEFNEIDYAGYEDENIVTKTLITSDLANSMGITDGVIPS
jgi:archaellum component FlaC